MNLTVIVNKAPHIFEGENLEEILGKCGYSVESVILLREGKIIVEEDIMNGDTVEAVPVASGG